MAKKKTETTEVKAVTTDITATLIELTQKLLTLSGVTGTVSVHEEKEEEGALYHVIIESENEAGLLIGAHGQTLLAIQSFLGMALRTRTNEWYRIVVDVSGWRQKHEEYLLSLAKQAADRAKQTQEKQYLYNLTPAQRRVIHTALSEMKGVKSESEGEGLDRCLVVSAE